MAATRDRERKCLTLHMGRAQRQIKPSCHGLRVTRALPNSGHPARAHSTPTSHADQHNTSATPPPPWSGIANSRGVPSIYDTKCKKTNRWHWPAFKTVQNVYYSKRLPSSSPCANPSSPQCRPGGAEPRAHRSGRWSANGASIRVSAPRETKGGRSVTLDEAPDGL
jgi:hypothetical protein